jgi:branched-chain amino acid transport system substrate-binding protein
MNRNTLITLAAGVIAASSWIPVAQAQDSMYMPSMSYRTGPYAGGGTPFADGYADYFNMLNERDGGIGGVKIVVEECETGYNTQKGVECYEATKGNGSLAYSPLSTGITLALIPKAPVDQIPVFSMGYGLSAAAAGEQFPWTFAYPATYWSQMSSILKYIDANGGIKGKKISTWMLVTEKSQFHYSKNCPNLWVSPLLNSQLAEKRCKTRALNG